MRYIRQEQLNFIPENFQNKIKMKNIILIGCGGIGSPLAELLIRGGFLNLTLIDFDEIEESNLNRQIYFEENLGEKKCLALKNYLIKINKKAKIKIFNKKLTKTNISKICKKSDLIIDATDNLEIRRVINSFSIKYKKDWLYNGAIKTEIISCLFYHNENLFDKVFNFAKKNEKATDSGILPSTTFTSASLAFNQILKYFLNIKEYKLVKLNMWTNQIYEVKLK